MSKLITVIGATGNQGGSVVDAALKSGAYKVRGITRNVESDASKDLTNKGVEMVMANINDESSLVRAFEVRNLLPCCCCCCCCCQAMQYSMAN